MDIVTERVRIPISAGGAMDGYLARPKDGGPRPAVLVFMEIFGINPHIRDVTERVAREGYVALAPDYFHRTGPGAEYGYDEKGLAAGMKLLGALRADEMIADAKAALAFLRDRPDVRGDRIGTMGFCIGGHMAYLVACETDVRATASFYGGGIAASQGPGGGTPTVDRTSKIGGTVLLLFGGQDAMIPGAQIDAIRAALAKSGVRHHIEVYPQAGHGFFCNQRASYDEAAATDAWRRVKDLFARELG
ncbi:MAG: dienelactone hydrolase family protein [Deltaproteobacteria bacterium]|nr:dienelactone hydrolase family protein [Deltaproteobacteria bacterium]